MLVEILARFDLKPTDLWMILLGMPLFWLYYKLSSSVLFTPLLKLYEAREAATIGAQEGASDTIEEAMRLETVCIETLDEARRQAVAQRLERLSVAGKEASTIVSGADAVAKSKTAKGRQEMSEAEAKLRSQLTADVDSLAGDLAGRVLEGQAA